MKSGGNRAELRANLLVQALRAHTVKLRQIRIQHHALAAQHVDRGLYFRDMWQLHHPATFSP
jgi:hypothetical protein